MQKQWVRPFFTIWGAQALSLFGSELAGFGVIWWLTESTGSATVLATATIFSMVPSIILGPFAGALVDRWDRRRVMMVADACIAIATAVLALIHLSGQLESWHVYALLFVRSLGSGFHWPAMTASTSLMVPDEHLARVAGMNQTLRGVSTIAMPPLGALLLSVLPLGGILAIDMVTALIAISPLVFIHVPQPLREDDGPVTVRAVWGDMVDGLRYLKGWPAFLAIAINALMINFLLAPAFALSPILVTEYFHGEAFQLAWLNSAFGGGLIAGGLVLSTWGGFRKRVYTMLFGLAGMGLGCLAIGLAPPTLFPMALFGMLWAGFFNPITNGPVFALMQSTVEPSMQGRVLGVLNSLSMLASPLAMAVAGPAIRLVGHLLVVSYRRHRLHPLGYLAALCTGRHAHRGGTPHPPSNRSSGRHARTTARAIGRYGELERACQRRNTPPRQYLGGVRMSF